MQTLQFVVHVLEMVVEESLVVVLNFLVQLQVIDFLIWRQHADVYHLEDPERELFVRHENLSGPVNQQVKCCDLFSMQARSSSLLV